MRETTAGVQLALPTLREVDLNNNNFVGMNNDSTIIEEISFAGTTLR